MFYKVDENQVVVELSYAKEDPVSGWIETAGAPLIGYRDNGDGTFSRVPVTKVATRQNVSDEAERRIEAGTVINRIQFRCDDKSLRRLGALVRGFDRDAIGPEGKTYQTAAGVLITFVTKEDAEVVLNAAEDFESAILERSAQLQQFDPIPDPAQDALWDVTKSISEALEELT